MIFDFQGKAENITVSVVEGDDVQPPSIESIHVEGEGEYVILDWYEDSEYGIPYDFDTLVVKDITIYAKLEFNDSIHAVIWHMNLPSNYEEIGLKVNGNKNLVQEVKVGDIIKEPAITLSYEGDGTAIEDIRLTWYSDAEYKSEYVFGSQVTSDLNLYAKWDDIVDDNNTYYVFNSDGLYSWAEKVSEVAKTRCTLLTDIVIPAKGSNWNAVPLLNAVFNGNGHSINGMKITSMAHDNGAGFISQLDTDGKITKLGFIDAEIAMDNSTIGGIVGANYGMIEGCYYIGNVSSHVTEDNEIGGIAGYNEGTISGCYSLGNISSDGILLGFDGHNVGGITGRNNDNASVNSCYFVGTVSASGAESNNNAGGIFGVNWNKNSGGTCYWHVEDGASGGAINDTPIKVDGITVTWTDAKEAMNAYGTDLDLKYVETGDANHPLKLAYEE